MKHARLCLAGAAWLSAAGPVAAQEFKLLHALEGHAGQVGSLAFSPDGKTLLSAGMDVRVRLWDVAGGKAAGVVKLRVRTSDELARIAVSPMEFGPGGKPLASGGAGGAVKLWDAATGECTAALAHPEGGRVLTVGPGGRALASVGDDGRVRLWDLPGGKHTITFEFTAPAYCAAFSPDGKVLAAGHDDKENLVRLWDVRTGENTAALKGHGKSVVCVAFSPDGKALASGGWDGTARLWDAAGGRQVAVLQQDADERADPGGRVQREVVLCVAFSPSGKVLAAGGSDTAVRLWDAASGRRLGTLLEGDRYPVLCLAFSPDGKRLASGDSSGQVKLWDVTGAVNPDR